MSDRKFPFIARGVIIAIRDEAFFPFPRLRLGLLRPVGRLLSGPSKRMDGRKDWAGRHPGQYKKLIYKHMGQGIVDRAGVRKKRQKRG